MKSLFLPILFFLLSYTVSAQEVKKVKRHPKGTMFTDEYFVLKRAKNTKHGAYKRTLKGKIIETGFYRNGKRDSLWTIYAVNSGQIVYKGKYREDVRRGVWEFYEPREKFRKWFDYDHFKVIRYEYDKDARQQFEVKTSDGIQIAKLDQPPMLIESQHISDEKLKYFVSSMVKYPMQAIISGTEGTVLVSFFIDENGTPKDYAVEKGIGNGCDEEALKIIKSIEKINYIPGMLNGKNVTAKYNYPVNFTLR